MEYNKDNNKPKKLIGSVLAATLFMFGAASCTTGNDVADTGVVDDNYAVTETVANDDINTFTAWDDNSDNMWDEQEFTTGIGEAGVFDDWDTDNDNMYSENEFNNGLYGTWDQNDDGFIDNEEYGLANAGWEDDFGDNFSTWDANDDNMLDTNEFNNGIGDVGLYDNWDTDRNGMFSDDEFYSGLYDSWDNDNDGYLGLNEYNDFGFNNWGI